MSVHPRTPAIYSLYGGILIFKDCTLSPRYGTTTGSPAASRLFFRTVVEEWQAHLAEEAGTHPHEM